MSAEKIMEAVINGDLVEVKRLVYEALDMKASTLKEDHRVELAQSFMVEGEEVHDVDDDEDDEDKE